MTYTLQHGRNDGEGTCKPRAGNGLRSASMVALGSLVCATPAMAQHRQALNEAYAAHTVATNVALLSTTVRYTDVLVPEQPHAPRRWIVTSGHARFGAAPQLQQLGDSIIQWEGWNLYPNGDVEHDWGNSRWRAFERVGIWSFFQGTRCDATIFVRLRITVRPPVIDKHGHSHRRIPSTLASFSYAMYTPAGIRLPVTVRRIR